MKPIEEIEINLVPEAIYQRYGHDFRQLAINNPPCSASK